MDTRAKYSERAKVEMINRARMGLASNLYTTLAMHCDGEFLPPHRLFFTYSKNNNYK